MIGGALHKKVFPERAAHGAAHGMKRTGRTSRRWHEVGTAGRGIQHGKEGSGSSEKMEN